ncbi:MAG: AAA family ATPase [Taibaiella sp.]|nr:AAA family ATPase [Taibaiella sp.]
MQLKQANRKSVKLRLNLASPSGFGKTYSALLLAFGITNDWTKIAVIDTENDSASLYAHLGNFQILSLAPPFTTQRYIEAIQACENAHMEVIVIDSITHVWKGQGGLLEYQNSLGGRYQDWARVSPLYQYWLNAILQSKCHVITTNRKKQGYNMITENNKTKVEKAGLDDEIRDGYDYEVTVALEIINANHLARASKDRTGLFMGKPEFVISSETGKQLLQWCNAGTSVEDEVKSLIQSAKDTNELLEIFNQYPSCQAILQAEFAQKRQSLEVRNTMPIFNPQKINANGIHNR